jgi:hypothetical protein
VAVLKKRYLIFCVSLAVGMNAMSDNLKELKWYSGHPIYIATKQWQRRKHRKKRINKKWLKRYGTCEINMMPHNQVMMMDNGVIWMTKRTWEQLKEQIDD